MNDHHPLGIERFGRAESGDSPQFDPAPKFANGEAEVIFDRLQRNGGALSSCECGSRNWLPPDGIYQLVATTLRRTGSGAHHIPTKAVVPVTCAACGLTKFYDPAVVASLAESSGRW